MKDLLWSTALFFLLIAHPFLVRQIIFQFETPFVTRIGLVIITYPILLASVSFCLKMLGYPKKEDVAHRLAHKKGPISSVSILLAIPLLPVVIFLGFAAGQELQLRHQLLQEGISGIATVQKCERKHNSRRGSSCHLSYEYKVRVANNTTKSYRVREQISCPIECKIGSSVDITYLPQKPAEASIEGNTYDLNVSVLGLTMCFNILCIILTKRQWERLWV